MQRPSILIADEITANLDHQNAQWIESLLLSLQDTMVISIGHRLLPEVLSRYDCILTMGGGFDCRVRFLFTAGEVTFCRGGPPPSPEGGGLRPHSPQGRRLREIMALP